MKNHGCRLAGEQPLSKKILVHIHRPQKYDRLSPLTNILVFCTGLLCKVHAATSFFISCTPNSVLVTWDTNVCLATVLIQATDRSAETCTYLVGAGATSSCAQEPVMLTPRHGRTHMQLPCCNYLNTAGGIKPKPALVKRYLSLFSTFCFSPALLCVASWAYPWHRKKAGCIFRGQIRHIGPSSTSLQWEKPQNGLK